MKPIIGQKSHIFVYLIFLLMGYFGQAHLKPLSENKDSIIYLSPEFVSQRILKNSLRYQKIKAKEKASFRLQAEAMAFLDWQLLAQTRFQSKEQKPLSVFENPLEKENNTQVGLEKRFLTGTRLRGQYSLFHFEKNFTPEFQKISSSPAFTFRQKMSLEVEQDLWRNIFGYEDRINLSIAEAKTESMQIKLLEAKEDLILQALGQFWKTYVSQVSLNLKKNREKDYGELYRITKKKQALSYIKPGELEQIQAEWEKSKQGLIGQKTDYENQLSKLLELLNLSNIIGSQTDGSQTDGSQTDGSQTDGSQTDGSQTDGSQTDGSPIVRFKVQSHLLPPVLNTPWPQTPRTVELMKKQLFIQEQEQKAQTVKNRPGLKLFGSYSFGGYETDFASSFEGLKARNNQSHSFGIKFVYPLPSSVLRKKRMEFHEQALKASRLDLRISQQEFMVVQEQSIKNIKTLYQTFKSAQKIQHLRSQSYKKIRKAFLQGRLSVFELIRAKELSLLAEQEKSEIQAQYYQALYYIKALQDQLIP